MRRVRGLHHWMALACKGSQVMSVARRNIMTLGIVTLSVVAMGAHQASAADPKLEQTALSLAPEDSAFFATSLNMRQSYEEFMESRFVQRLKAVPFVRRLESELVDQWDNPSEELKQAKFFLDSPAAQNLVKLVIDMSSTEFFFYGENDWCEAIEGIMRVQNDLSGLANQGEEAIRQYILDLQPNDVAVMRVPTTVVGFKLSSDEIAREQLDTLEGIIRLGLSSNEELSPIARQLKRADFKDGQSLSLTLNTDMIPRIDLDGDQAEMMDKILELLEGRSLSIAVGVKANMLLFTISEKADALKQVGANETQLLNHDAIAVLVEQAPEDLRSISFNSERWRQSSWDANLGRYFERLAAQFSAAMESEPENIPDMEQWQSEIMVDAKWLDAKIAEAKPDFGATLSWSHAIDGGMEGFTYDWTTNQGVKNSTAASLLAFAGGNPLISVGMKQAEIPVLEEIVGYVLERAPDHLRRFIDAAEQDPDDKEKALLALNRGWVLMEEICETMRDKISPALNSHETVFSIAANWKQTQIADLPPSPRPLPLPEMAFACRLADRDLFLEGCNDILIMLDKFVDLVREIEPNSIPENYRVPRPDEEALAGGTRYFYSSLSRQVPLEGFEPQLLVGDNAVIAGYSMRQVDAMLAGEAPDILPSWIQADSPVAVISYANFAGMIEAVRPWAVYGIGLSGIDLDAPVADEEGPVPTPNDLLQIWDTLTELGQSYATATVQPNGTLITRWQWTNAN